ncbi:MAG: hypothetical protein HYZ29_17235 [Myxococcales bacterium]|nr:hypothetical protein [Myxococcales bacterium]
MTKPKTNKISKPSTPAKPERMTFVGLRMPPEWIDAVKQHCEQAGFPGSHPTIIRRAIEIGLKTMGIEAEPR